ncbi:unnamed protein product [Ambrosiozyma monospora]|uniref:Unnamed protein product n=1 Tax=Ambrosiozyma monospora TaxID=43982 RepID=A0ACB5T5M8_AMBMO|nr:unnamed protein product [Ambrosiozyma monospora]
MEQKVFDNESDHDCVYFPYYTTKPQEKETYNLVCKHKLDHEEHEHEDIPSDESEEKETTETTTTIGCKLGICLSFDFVNETVCFTKYGFATHSHDLQKGEVSLSVINFLRYQRQCSSSLADAKKKILGLFDIIRRLERDRNAQVKRMLSQRAKRLRDTARGLANNPNASGTTVYKMLVGEGAIEKLLKNSEVHFRKEIDDANPKDLVHIACIYLGIAKVPDLKVRDLKPVEKTVVDLTGSPDNGGATRPTSHNEAVSRSDTNSSQRLPDNIRKGIEECEHMMDKIGKGAEVIKSGELSPESRMSLADDCLGAAEFMINMYKDHMDSCPSREQHDQMRERLSSSFDKNKMDFGDRQ